MFDRFEVFFRGEGLALLLSATIFLAIYALVRNYNFQKVGVTSVNLPSRYKYDLGPLYERLELYACLIGHEKFSVQGNAFKKREALTEGGHKILLGTLKKIEAKNAVLSAINIFLIAASVNFYAGYGRDLTSCQRVGLLAMIIILFVTLGGRIDGNGHLGQAHFNRLRRRLGDGVGRKDVPIEMQRELMRDLLRKEALFATSFFMIGLVMFGYVGLVAVGLFC